jgi:hypothetical protein
MPWVGMTSTSVIRVSLLIMTEGCLASHFESLRLRLAVIGFSFLSLNGLNFELK